MKHYETIQHLERKMNGLTLERTEKLVQNLRQIDNQRARNLQIYRSKVQQLEEEKQQLDMKSAMEEAMLQMLQHELYKEVTTTVENYTRIVQQLRKTGQKVTQEQFNDEQNKILPLKEESVLTVRKATNETAVQQSEEKMAKDQKKPGDGEKVQSAGATLQ